jgi:chromosome segregation and condensation protein ScpB
LPPQSPAGTGTLAIVAYNQRISRLRSNGRVVPLPNLEALLDTGASHESSVIARPAKTYGTTKAFLSHLGLAPIDGLPPLKDCSNGYGAV